jgi:hypothetical protein
MSSKKYWCPTCDDLSSINFGDIADPVPHRKHCQTLTEIPSVEPLAVPEPTTWGESGGAGEVCLSVYFDSVVYIRDGVFAWVDSMGWRVSDGVWQDWRDVPDIVDAINYVAGVTP